ncbi:MAG: hypoxanthine-guanine phosphoribosyltransferase [Gammaproteobacteria bacterium]|nr:hypoxanthine-guanine phosphoribosyltransferase [Gammaproteobacteria bacterium]
MKIPQDIQSILEKATCIYSKQEVEHALDRMALLITEEVSDLFPIFLCVVVGGMIPLGSLLMRMIFPLEINYIHATRYQGNTSGGEIAWKAKPTCPLADRTVVIVDDILDSGKTLSAIIKFCEDQGAKQVLTSVIVDKHHAREEGGLAQADFTGLTVDGDHYVFGYGMDYRGYLRNAPGIFAIAPEHR